VLGSGLSLVRNISCSINLALTKFIQVLAVADETCNAVHYILDVVN